MKKKIFKNLSWKLGGLVLAFALWFHITTNQQFNKEILLDLDYINIPQNLELAETSQESSLVTVTANGKKLFKLLYLDELILRVDLSAFTVPGKYSIELSREQVFASSNLADVEIDFVPSHICRFELVQAPQ